MRLGAEKLPPKAFQMKEGKTLGVLGLVKSILKLKVVPLSVNPVMYILVGLPYPVDTPL
jgi:hypothetical protein